ncbi:MAG: DUF4367 domain-containing protein [Bacillota bacterium]
MGPKYVPPGYTFKGHSLTPIGKDNVQITSYYEKGGRYLTVIQETVSDYSESQWFDVDDTAVFDVTVRDVPGKLFYRRKDGWAKIIWNHGNIRYEVAGPLSKEEILRVANSMQPL